MLHIQHRGQSDAPTRNRHIGLGCSVGYLHHRTVDQRLGVLMPLASAFSFIGAAFLLGCMVGVVESIQMTISKEMEQMESNLMTLDVEHVYWCSASEHGLRIVFPCDCGADQHNAMVEDCLRTLRGWI